MVVLTGLLGADSTGLSVLGGGVEALDNEGDVGAETPNFSNFFLCSDFCFFNRRFASSSARSCSRASRLPCLVEAPGGRCENQDMRDYIRTVALSYSFFVTSSPVAPQSFFSRICLR